jgi:hypothetical protein
LDEEAQDIIKTITKLQKKQLNVEYYKKNKEKLKENYSVKVQCPLCDRTINKSSLNTHLKSSICSKYKNIKKEVNKINEK